MSRPTRTRSCAANLRERRKFDLAVNAIRLFQGEVGDDLVLKADRFKPLRDKLLRGAVEFYGELERLLDGQVDQFSRRAMADAYYELGELTASIGDEPEALVIHQKGLAVRRELVSSPEVDRQAVLDLGKSLCAVANLLSATGISSEALARYDETRELMESLPVLGPGSDDCRALLGRSYCGIGHVLASMGKMDAALLARRRSVDIFAKLALDRPAEAGFQSLLAFSQLGLGGLLTWTDKLDEGVEWYHRALATQQKLVDDNPAVNEYRYRLACNHLALGKVQAQKENSIEAMSSYRRAIEVFEKLADDNPASHDFRGKMADCHNSIGNLLGDTGKLAEAITSHQRALAIRERLAHENPAVGEFRNKLASSHNYVGLLQWKTGKRDEALQSCHRALAIRQSLADENPGFSEFRIDLADSHYSIGLLLSQTGHVAEAMACYRRALRAAGKAGPGKPRHHTVPEPSGKKPNRYCHVNRERGCVQNASKPFRLPGADPRPCPIGRAMTGTQITLERRHLLSRAKGAGHDSTESRRMSRTVREHLIDEVARQGASPRARRLV